MTVSFTPPSAPFAPSFLHLPSLLDTTYGPPLRINVLIRWRTLDSYSRYFYCNCISFQQHDPTEASISFQQRKGTAKLAIEFQIKYVGLLSSMGHGPKHEAVSPAVVSDRGVMVLLLFPVPSLPLPLPPLLSDSSFRLFSSSTNLLCSRSELRVRPCSRPSLDSWGPPVPSRWGPHARQFLRPINQAVSSALLLFHQLLSISSRPHLSKMDQSQGSSLKNDSQGSNGCLYCLARKKVLIIVLRAVLIR